MLIGVDGNEANVDRKVGIGEFAYRLLAEFYLRKDDDLDFEIFLKNPPGSDMPKEDKHWKYRVVGPKKFWTQFGLPVNLYTSRKKPDVFFTPTHYAPRFSPVPCVVSIMDLSYIYYEYLFNKRDLYQLKNWTAYSVKNAGKIITISNSSKDDIIKYYKVPSGKIAVVYPGIKKILDVKYKELGMGDLNKKFGIEGDYILFVGTLQPRKNITRLIEAFAKTKKDLQLVIVGKKGWLYEDILSAPKKFGIEDRVKFLDFVKDEDLPSLYKNALCYVLPSLYEGFGLPVLEAMEYGCPVITSNISSLPEAGGNAALYIDPYNVEDIVEKIEKVVNSSALRAEMRKKGLEQVKKFSWEKSAGQVLEVLQAASRA